MANVRGFGGSVQLNGGFGIYTGGGGLSHPVGCCDLETAYGCGWVEAGAALTVTVSGTRLVQPSGSRDRRIEENGEVVAWTDSWSASGDYDGSWELPTEWFPSGHWCCDPGAAAQVDGGDTSVPLHFLGIELGRCEYESTAPPGRGTAVDYYSYGITQAAAFVSTDCRECTARAHVLFYRAIHRTDGSTVGPGVPQGPAYEAFGQDGFGSWGESRFGRPAGCRSSFSLTGKPGRRTQDFVGPPSAPPPTTPREDPKPYVDTADMVVTVTVG